MNWAARGLSQNQAVFNPFESTQEVLAGQRVELDELGRKVLRIVLGYPGGCDLVITPVNFEWMAERAIDAVQYEFEAAPGVVSELLRLAGVETPVSKVRALIGPGVIGSGVGFGRKVFWLNLGPDRVVIHLRTATGHDEHDLNKQPVPYPGLLVPALCPYCGEVLRTPRAKQCRFCKRDWHDPENVKWLDGRSP